MAEVTQIQEAFQWNITRLAEAFGLHRDTVRKRLKEAGVVPAGTRNGAAVYALKDVGPALFSDEFRAPSDDLDPTKFLPKDRLDWFRSEIERTKLEKELRNLIAAEDVARGYSRLAKALATALDSLPDLLERDAGLDANALEVVQRVVDELREQTYQQIIQDSGGE